MDLSKVETILNWPTPTIGTEVRIFHGLAQFYRNFSVICALVLEIVNGGLNTKFKWTLEVGRAFEIFQQEMAIQPILLLPSFDKLFTVECVASNVAVRAFFS